MNLQLRRVFVALSDPQSSLVPFYQALFGLEPSVLIPQLYAEFQLPGLQLGIFQPKSERWHEFSGQAGAMSLCLEVAELEAAIEHLAQLNCRRGPITTASHGREVYAYDPIGNRLILYQRYAELLA